MKTKLVKISIIALLAAGCSSTMYTANFDDVYYSPDENAAVNDNVQSGLESASPDYYTIAPESESGSNNNEYSSGEYVEYNAEEPYYSDTETWQDPEGNTYVTNNYYGSDDYYDYSYASRIKRFHDPYYGFGYYSPCYTNQYWYNYDPWYWGTSIYMGYPFWSPSMYFGFSYNWGWGSAGIGWGWPYYSSWHYPYYGMYSPYYGYGSYWHGYHDGYWAGYYGNSSYYNSYDYYSGYYYYGHRPSRGGSNNPYTGRNGNYSPFAEKYQASSVTTAGRGVNSNTTSVSRSASPGVNTAANRSTQATNRSTQPSGNLNNTGTAVRSTGNTTATNVQNSQNSAGRVAKEVPGNEATKQKYTYRKPVQSETQVKYNPGENIRATEKNQKTNTGIYEKPASYRSNNNNASTSRQYSKQENTQRQVNRQPVNTNTRSDNNAGNTYSTPQKSNVRTYSPPTRSNSRSYSPPARSSNSYSAPSRSSGSNSTPSRSSGSYSTPSRSSGSNSSSTRSSSSSSSSGSSSRGKR
ncbi:MAG: hypothetical protein JXA03_02130 [Bacteroidales bacterium]|nr:hypothetical protein [Bacteroidales bacterium]